MTSAPAPDPQTDQPVRTETVHLEGEAAMQDITQQTGWLPLVGPVVVTLSFVVTLVCHVGLRFAGVDPTGLEEILFIFAGAVGTIAIPAGIAARRS